MWHERSMPFEIPNIDYTDLEKTGAELLPYLTKRLPWLLELGKKLLHEGWVIDFTIGGMVVDHPASWEIEDLGERIEYMRRKYKKAGIAGKCYESTARFWTVLDAMDRYSEMMKAYYEDPSFNADLVTSDEFERGRMYGRYEALCYVLSGEWCCDPEDYL